MATKKKHTQPLKMGDRVEVHYYPALRGRIIELRGPLGPGGLQVYRVRFERKPKPLFIELTEDQLELISPPES